MSRLLATSRLVRLGLAVISVSLVLRTSAAVAASGYFSFASGSQWDNATTSDWSSVSGGPYTSLWASGSDAVFEGTAGNVAVSGTVSSVNSITFGVDGYTLGGSGTITMTGTGGDITTGSGTDTIGAILAGSVGLTKLGTGTLALSGLAVNTFTGGVTVNGGTLRLDFTNLATPTNLVGSGNALTLGGGTLAINGYAATAVNTSQTLASLTVNPGANTISLAANGGNNTSLTITSSTITKSTGGTLNFVLPTSASSVSWNPTLSGGIIGTWATIGAAGSVQYATIVGGKVAAYTGTSAATAANMTDTTGAVNYNLAAGGTLPNGNNYANSVVYTGSTAATILPGTNNFGFNGLIANGAAGTTLTIGSVAGINNYYVTDGSYGATQSFHDIVIAGQQNVTIDANFYGNPNNASALTYSGTGTLTLGYTGTNNLNGPVTVNSGGVVINGAMSTSKFIVAPAAKLTVAGSTTISLGTGSSIAGNVTINSAGAEFLLTTAANVFNGGSVTFTAASGNPQFELKGNNQTVNGLISATTAAVIQNTQNEAGVGNSTLTINTVNSTDNFSYQGYIRNSNAGSGTLSFVKSGPGTQTLSDAANTVSYTGTTTINGGILQVNGPNGSPTSGIGASSLITINNGGTLVTGNDNGLIGATAAVPITINTGGTLTATGTPTNNLHGLFTLAGGVLASPATVSGDALTYGYWDLNSGLTTAATATATSVISAQNVGLTQTGGTIFTVNPATIQSVTGIDLDVTGYFGQPSGVTTTALIKNGTGVMRLDTANTYTSATTVNAGRLIFSNTKPASASVVVSTGAFLEYAVSSAVVQSGTTYTGAGTLVKSGASNLTFGSAGTVNVNFSAGALIDVQGGTLTASSGNQANWANNNAALNIAGGAIVNTAEAGGSGATFSTFKIDALTGAGTFQGGYSPEGVSTAQIGVANGSGTFSGVVKDFTGFGTLAIAKLGTGTETLSGANTYSGTTTINGGTLRAGAANTLPSTTAVTLANTTGVTLDLNGNSQSIKSLAGGGTTGGNVTLGSGTLTVNGSSSTTFSGGISGTGGLTLSGSGTLALPGVNLYTGATSIGSAATLNIGGGTLGDATHLSAVSVNGTLRGAGTIWGSVAVAAGGKIDLTDAAVAPMVLNTSLAVGDNTTPSVLTFEANSAGTDSINVNGPLTVNGSTTINITALGNLTTGTYPLINFTSFTGSLASFTLGTPIAGGRNLQLTNDGSTMEQLIVLGAGAYWNGGSGTWNAGTPWTSDLNGANTTTAPNASTDVFFNANGTSGAITTSLGQAFDIGSLTFNGNATGSVVISDATFGLTIESGGISVLSGSGAHTISVNGVTVHASQTWLNNSGNPLTVTSGITGPAGTPVTLTLGGTGNGGFALGGPIADGASGGTLSLTVNVPSGAVVTLGSANTYTGTTTVNSGTLRATANNVVGGSLRVAGGTFDVGAFSTTVAGLQLTGGASVTGTAGIITSNSAYDLQNGSVSANLAGSVGLNKTTGGLVTLSGNNSFTGVTSVVTSVPTDHVDLALNSATGPAVPGNVTNGGWILVNNSANQFGANAVMTFSSTGSSGFGVLELSGHNQSLAGISSSSGFGVIENAQSQAPAGGNSSVLTINTVNSGDNFTYSGTLRNNFNGQTGTIGIAKSGPGVQTLSGAAIAYTGPTTITNGRLTLANTTGFASSASVASGAALEINTTSAAWITAANINLTGAGTVLKTGANSWVVGGLNGANVRHVNFNLSAGGLIDIEAGEIQTNFTGNSFGGNLASLNIAGGATIDLFSESGQFDALTGAGTLTDGYGAGSTNTATIGASDGTGTFSGLISGSGNGTGGAGQGKLAIAKIGAGVQTLSGANTYSGGTTITGGALRASNGTNGSATGTGPVTLNVGTLAGSVMEGSITGLVSAGSGMHSIAPGAGLTAGTFGTLNLNGGLTTSSNTTLAFNLGTTTTGGIYVGDLLNIGGAFTADAGTQFNFGNTPPTAIGDYRLIGGTYTFGMGSLANLTAGLPTAPPSVLYSLSSSVDSGYLDLVVTASNASLLTLSPSHLQVRSMVGGSQTGTATLTETSGTYAAAYSTSDTGSAAAFTPTGTVSAGGMTPVGIGFSSYSSTGARSGSVMFSNTANAADGFNSANNTVTLDAGSAVVANRSVTAGTVTLPGVFHAGTDLSTNNYDATLSTTGDDNNFTRVTVQGSATVFDGSGGTGSSQMRSFAGPMSVAASGTLGTLTVATAESGGGLAGEGSYASINVPYVATATSGLATWISNSGTSWTNANWADDGNSGIHVAPGLFAGYTNTDTATFDGTGTTTSVTLDGAAPHLSGITFTGGGGLNYTISQGSGGTGRVTLSSTGPATIAAVAGSHTISAPLTVTGGLSTSGAGTVTLAGGGNSFTGPITVGDGTNTGTLRMNVISPSTIDSSVSVTVAASATLELDGMVSALQDGTNHLIRPAIINSGTLAAGDVAAMIPTMQQVGGIDGTGSVVVNDTASLTADHINQTSLVIGNGSVFTLAPSDMNGNPMEGVGSGQLAVSTVEPAAGGSGFVLAGSLAPSSSFVGSTGSLLAAGSTSSAPSVSLGSVGGASVSAVPSPSQGRLHCCCSAELRRCRCGGAGLRPEVRRLFKFTGG